MHNGYKTSTKLNMNKRESRGTRIKFKQFIDFTIPMKSLVYSRNNKVADPNRMWYIYICDSVNDCVGQLGVVTKVEYTTFPPKTGTLTSTSVSVR